MSVVLQVALALAALAFVALVASLVPAILQLRRQADQIAATVQELRGEVATLVVESRETLTHVNELATRVERQWDTVETVVETVHGWADRADHVIREVDAVIEPPLLRTIRAIGLAKVGVTAFRDFFRRPRRGAVRTDEGGE